MERIEQLWNHATQSRPSKMDRYPTALGMNGMNGMMGRCAIARGGQRRRMTLALLPGGPALSFSPQKLKLAPLDWFVIEVAGIKGAECEKFDDMFKRNKCLRGL